MIRTLVVLLFVCVISSCSSEFNQAVGPEGSWWVGGVDGGVFIAVEDDDTPSDGIYFGTIYYDSDHSIWYRGRLKLNGSLNFKPEDKEVYLGWDGERLLLVESSYLQAIDPINEI
jgi:hypothetical protein